MKMNKKGFTLIELLAVIVILAIIALIATPVIMNVINTAQENSDARAVESYAKELESQYYQYVMSHPTEDMTAKKTALVTNFGSSVKLNGTQVNCGEATTQSMDENGVITLNGCYVGNRTTKKYNYTSNTGASLAK